VNDTDTPALTGPSEASGVLPPLPQTPTARFSISPTSPVAHSAVVFDGRLSCVGIADPDATTPCPAREGTITSFTWNFGDGSTATGPTASHAYNFQQTFNVTLTVTNDSGRSNSMTRAVNIGQGLRPTADFVISPTSVSVGQTVFVNGSISEAGGGHVITQFAWNWGDGVTTTGLTSSHVYTVSGTYVVGLTVVDEAGQTHSTTKNVNVGTGQPTATFSFAPLTSPTMAFDASASTAQGTATIVNYAWAFGDGKSASGSAATVTNLYPAPGTYTVTLTVTDSLGRSGVISQNVTVP
jgi:PKD repeat protein